MADSEFIDRDDETNEKDNQERHGNAVISWFKRNSTIITATGIIVSAIAAGIAIAAARPMPTAHIVRHAFSPRSGTRTMPLPDHDARAIATAVPDIIPNTSDGRGHWIGDTRQHVRNLPEGWHASPEKIQRARELGILLEDNQTLVNSSTRNRH